MQKLIFFIKKDNNVILVDNTKILIIFHQLIINSGRLIFKRHFLYYNLIFYIGIWIILFLCRNRNIIFIEICF